VEALQAIANRHGLKLIYDAAHAFACSRDGRTVGGFGDAEVLSFHATKFVNSFEGGAIVTRDQALAERCRLMRNFGFEYLDSVVSLGINTKMSEIHAAMGLVSLDAMEGFIAGNRANHAAYAAGLAGIPGISLLEVPPDLESNCQYVVLQVDAEATGISRDQLLETLLAEGLFARRYFHPGVHRMQPYASQRDPETWDLPVTERLSASLLQLPAGPAMGRADLDAACGLIRFVAENAAELSPRIAPKYYL